jgi:hypothetical protein
MTSMSPPVNNLETNDLNASELPSQVPRQDRPERSQAKTSFSFSTTESPDTTLTEPAHHDKDTTGNLTVKPRMSPKLAKTIDPSKRMSRTESGLPAWAGPLEKALAEDTSKVPALTNQTKLSSTPSHLRKPPKATNMSAESAYHTDLDPVATRHPSASFNLDAQFKAACEATRRVSSSTTAMRSENDQTLASYENRVSSYDIPKDIKKVSMELNLDLPS